MIDKAQVRYTVVITDESGAECVTYALAGDLKDAVQEVLHEHEGFRLVRVEQPMPSAEGRRTFYNWLR